MIENVNNSINYMESCYDPCYYDLNNSSIHILNRLAKFKSYAPNGCSCISFYDFIRIYDISIINDLNIDLPIHYIDMNLNLELPYVRIAKSIQYSELLYYERTRNLLLSTFISSLSCNPYLPLNFIFEHQDLNWDWGFISKYNQSFKLTDLIELSQFLIYDYLSSNPCILLEWILIYPDLPWNYLNLSSRLTVNEIKKLHNDVTYRTKLNWYIISNHNPNVTGHIIIQNPDLPWNLYPKTYLKYLLDPDQDLSDMKQEIGAKIGITYISRNRNVTYDQIACSGYDLSIFNHQSLKTNKMDQPKLIKYYKTIYNMVIQEIKFY